MWFLVVCYCWIKCCLAGLCGLLVVGIPRLVLVRMFDCVCFSCDRFGVVWLLWWFSVTCSWLLVVFVFVDLWSGC